MMTMENNENSSQDNEIEEFLGKVEEDNLENWQNKVFEEKISSALESISLDIEINAAKERNLIIIQQMRDEEDEIEEIEDELENIYRKKHILQEAFYKMVEFRTALSTRAESLEAMQRLQFDAKHDHHLKLVNSISKKIEDTIAIKQNIESQHNEELDAKTEQLKLFEAEKTKVCDEELGLQNEIQQDDEALKAEEEELGCISKKIDDARLFFGEILEVQAITEQIKNAKDAEAQALEQNRLKIDQIHIDNVDMKEKIEENEVKLQKLYEDSYDLENQQEKYFEIVNVMQSQKTSIQLIENYEIFQREYQNSILYLENKAKVEVMKSENTDLYEDLEKVSNLKSKYDDELVKLFVILQENEKQKSSMEFKLTELKSKEITKQVRLKERQDAIQMAETAAKQEIREMKLAHVNLENEIDRLRAEHQKAVNDIAIKLKLEQAKTKDAKDRHIASLKEEKALNLGPILAYSQPMRKKDDDKSDSSRVSMTQYPGLLRRSLQTPQLSSSFESVSLIPNRHQRLPVPAVIPVYKEEFKKKEEMKKKDEKKDGILMDIEPAFTEDEEDDSMNFTYNTDIENLLDETLTRY